MLFIFVWSCTVRRYVSSYLIVMNMIRWLGLGSCALFWVTARSWVHSAVARCRAQADGGTVRLAVAVGAETHSRKVAGPAADSSLVGGEMRSRQVAGCAAGTCPLVGCRGDVKCQTHYSLLDCHQQSYSFGSRRQITPCSIGAGCSFLMYRRWLVLLDVSALTGPSWCIGTVLSAGWQLTIYALSPEQVLSNCRAGSNGCGSWGSR